jgi:hypothetical protein
MVRVNRWPQSIVRLRHIPLQFVVALLILAALLVGLQEFSILFAHANEWLPPARSPLNWVGPVAFLLVLVWLTILGIPDRAHAFKTPQFKWWQSGLAALWMVTIVYNNATVFAEVICDLREHESPTVSVGLRAAVLVQCVLLLAGAGMVRWYSERRNHLAQATHYDDMLRAFRRSDAWKTGCSTAVARSTRMCRSGLSN